MKELYIVYFCDEVASLHRFIARGSRFKGSRFKGSRFRGSRFRGSRFRGFKVNR
ncbi:MAG: pentapeptide repeat-containing protein [Desulfobacterales bacterium]|nr:pentapeptide repeat-containing protein [Desulfobacterales bacterium]